MNIPEGYRALKDGELIKKGDMWFCVGGGAARPHGWVEEVMECYANTEYRTYFYRDYLCIRKIGQVTRRIPTNPAFAEALPLP